MPTRQMIICRICTRATQYKSFAKKRSTRSSCWTERDTVGRLCEQQEDTVLRVLSDCLEMVGDRAKEWPNNPVNEIVCHDQGGKFIRKFLRLAIQ
ncbi:hypothetical protein PoB_004140700 [Plakobranchus ocellatus]|uniref:Saposin B-type domain-containing protein n=1 Tax=Plakobranchus ocellatus TaxID=259542 RepID=A0AAV4B5W3_9GAST|nr:hypothetical protein PoB_004140700 [Plakobranchus ocellatus]